MPDLVQVVEKCSGVAAALDAEARVLDVAYTQSIRDGKATGVVKVVIVHLRDWREGGGFPAGRDPS